MNISFIGTKPYITYNPIGGSEFHVVKILSEKFKFIPKFIPERSFDIVNHNGTLSGMFHKVRVRIKIDTKSSLELNFLGFHQAK